MATEIELKAWADDHEGLRQTISAIACFSGSFTKEDAYWFPPTPMAAFPSGIRIRKQTHTDAAAVPVISTWVTYKTKEVRDGIEVNDEQEFAVSNGEVFQELLCRLGFRPGIRKHKQGWAWTYKGLTVELACIEGLGWFVEVEILSEGETAVEEARSRLLDFLRTIGIGEDKIESRYYTELLSRSSICLIE